MKHQTNEFRQYVAMGVLGMLGSSGTILADTFFVSGRLGADGLAALNLAIPVFGLLNGAGMMAGMGSSVRFGMLRAQGRPKEADRAFTLAFQAAAVLGLGFWMAGRLGAGTVARLLGAGPELLPLCRGYLAMVLQFGPCFLLNHLLTWMVRADGRPRLAMGMMVSGSLTNLVLDYLFLNPLNLGMAGAALATGLAPAVSLAVGAVCLLRKKPGFRWVKVRPDLPALAGVLQPGTAALVTEVSSGAVLAAWNLLFWECGGTEGVAAYGIVANLALMVRAVFSGISQGVQPLVSRACGAGDAEAADSLRQKGNRLCLALGACLLAAVWIWAPAVAGWFNPEQNALLQTMAEEGLRLYFIGFLWAGQNDLTAAFLSTTGRVRPAFWLSLVRGTVGILLMACLFAACWGAAGIWAAFPVVELACAALEAGWEKMPAPKKRRLPRQRDRA